MLDSWTLPRAGIVKNVTVFSCIYSVCHLMPPELLSRYSCQLIGPVARYDAVFSSSETSHKCMQRLVKVMNFALCTVTGLLFCALLRHELEHTWDVGEELD